MESLLRLTSRAPIWLSRVDGSKAKFRQVNLAGADFTGAELKEAEFQGAALVGVNHLSLRQLTSVKSLSRANLAGDIRAILEEKYPHLLEP